MSVTSIVDGIFELKSREFGDINNIFKGLNIGLECDFNDDVSSSLAIDTNGLSPLSHQPAVNSSPTGVGLSQTSVIDNDLCAVSPAIIIITNENKSKIKYESGPSSRYKQTQTGYTTAPAIGVTYTPSFNLSPTGVGLAEFNRLKCDFNAVLASTATVTIETNENKNKSILESGSLWGHNTQTPHPTPDPTAPRIDASDGNGPTNVGLCEFDNIGCIFDSNMGRIGLQYDISLVCVLFFPFFSSFVLFFLFYCQRVVFFVFVLTQKY